jgi:hypothetical protein
VALSHYELSLRSREFPYTQNVEQEDKARDYHRKKREIGKKVTSYKDREDREKNKHSLSHLSDYELETETHNQIWNDAPPEYKDMPDDVYDSDDSVSLASNENDHDTKESAVDDGELMAFADHQEKTPLDRKELACLKKILSGKCESQNCVYGHKTEILQKGAKDLRDKLTAYLDTGSAKPPEKPYTVLQKTKF